MPKAVVHLPVVVLVDKDVMARRRALVVTDQLVDRTFEGGRKEHGLAVSTGSIEEPADGWEETHVGHPIGLVDDHQGNEREVDIPLFDQVLEPTGAGHQDVHPAPQGSPLLAVAHSPVHGGDPRSDGRGEGRQGDLHLGGQLTRGHQDQGIRTATVAAIAFVTTGTRLEPGQHRQAERQGLAGPGRGHAAHVPAGEGIRQRGHLNRERNEDSAPLERAYQRGGHAQIDKSAIGVGCPRDGAGRGYRHSEEAGRLE